MKDVMDKATPDLIDQVQKPIGRPRIHANGAARQKAYRERKFAAGYGLVTRWVKKVEPPEQEESAATARPRMR